MQIKPSCTYLTFTNHWISSYLFQYQPYFINFVFNKIRTSHRNDLNLLSNIINHSPLKDTEIIVR